MFIARLALDNFAAGFRIKCYTNIPVKYYSPIKQLPKDQLTNIMGIMSPESQNAHSDGSGFCPGSLQQIPLNVAAQLNHLAKTAPQTVLELQTRAVWSGFNHDR